MDTQELSARINNILYNHKTFKVHEIDFAKFDKSQEEICLKFLCKLMSVLGVSQKTVQFWLHCHTNNILIFDKLGIKINT